MLIRLHSALEAEQHITLQKQVRGEDVSSLGAFEKGDVIVFTARIPRTLGVAATVLRIAPDGGEQTDLPFAFSATEGDADLYTLSLFTADLCGNAPDGLFFYELLFLRGFDTLFSSTPNNVDFTLTEHSDERFHLLVYAKDFRTPAWFHGGVMYHVFLDRFCKGEGWAELHPGASLNGDWESGIPQYAAHAGDPLANNVFFGGNLWGVCEKLDYLQSLGVTVLYLSPMFSAASNHRYDTASYELVDALLGGDEAFATLAKEAHARGMKIILDGVFNHTGDDSVYFNRRGTYPTVGAYQSKESPYAEWYNFRRFPTDYESWWGIEIMPRLKHNKESCRRYFTGADGIAAKWIRAGADGWRLDVADELSDAFLDEFHDTVKRETGGAGLIIGEVWENAATKIAYGNRRRYFRGKQLDSVMNYPFRNAVMAFLQEGDAETFYHILTELYASYPPTVSHSLMNLLGTHDTERILTVLGDPSVGEGRENAALSTLRLSEAARREAIGLLKIASVLQFTVYGVPSVYYGDEAGLEGYHDPFCRMPFPWGREEPELLEHYRWLGRLRHRHPALKEGDFRFLACEKHAFAFERFDPKSGDRLTVAANMGNTDFTVAGHTVPPRNWVIVE
ncbi:MAG: glycoside hydrolase family 13 protein [Clostridia bacterium]|nr:glycoside hydrolase family 13 protein [Clostridia bacterium]